MYLVETLNLPYRIYIAERFVFKLWLDSLLVLVAMPLIASMFVWK